MMSAMTSSFVANWNHFPTDVLLTRDAIKAGKGLTSFKLYTLRNELAQGNDRENIWLG